MIMEKPKSKSKAAQVLEAGMQGMAMGATAAAGGMKNTPKLNKKAIEFAAGAAEGISEFKNSFGRKNMNSKMTPRSFKELKYQR